MTVGGYTLLFTCRDVGAAHHIKEIIRAFRGTEAKISVIASDAAFALLHKEGLNPGLFELKNGRGYIPKEYSHSELEELIGGTGRILDDIKPNILFCGLATADFGIDEAALFLARKDGLNIPSFQFLDSWGTFNHLKDGYPDMYFAIDEATKELGRMGAMAPIKVVGSPKHFAYSSKPLDEWRKETRAILDVSEDEKLVAYFGQDPDVPGHTYNFKLLLSAVRRYVSSGGKAVSLMRPHPAYRDKFAPYWEFARETGIDLVAADDLPAEDILCACDIAATCFSTSAIDHAYLSCFSGKPLGTSLYLLCGEDIKVHMVANFGYWKTPLLHEGIGYYVDAPESMVGMLEYLLDNPSAVKSYFQASKSLQMNNPGETIIETVFLVLNGLNA